MNYTRTAFLAAGAIALAAISLPLGSRVGAQQSPPSQPSMGGQEPGPTSMPAQMQPMDRNIFMGPANMLMDGGNLYIYQNGHVWKLSTTNLQVLQHTDLGVVFNQGMRRGGQ